MQLSDRIGRRMKLHDLHVLMAVVQAGSMSKAAVLLNTTQPAISRSIAELERTIGARLLDRNTQGVEPTKYGRALLDGGAAVFDDLRQAVKNIEFLADPTAGEVRIGCNPFLATSFVSAVVDRLSRRYPRVVFHVAAEPVEILQRELSARNVDLLVAWRFGPSPDQHMEFEFLFDDSFVVVAGAQNPWVRRRRSSLPTC
jgi:DNA-binding transcriptional LysR family regulator